MIFSYHNEQMALGVNQNHTMFVLSKVVPLKKASGCREGDPSFFSGCLTALENARGAALGLGSLHVRDVLGRAQMPSGLPMGWWHCPVLGKGLWGGRGVLVADRRLLTSA